MFVHELITMLLELHKHKRIYIDQGDDYQEIEGVNDANDMVYIVPENKLIYEGHCPFDCCMIGLDEQEDFASKEGDELPEAAIKSITADDSFIPPDESLN